VRSAERLLGALEGDVVWDRGRRRVEVPVALTPFDWRVLRLAADQGSAGAGTGGIAAALGVAEDRVIRSALRLERAGFLQVHPNRFELDPDVVNGAR
jgi:hypothetical protein